MHEFTLNDKTISMTLNVFCIIPFVSTFLLSPLYKIFWIQVIWRNYSNFFQHCFTHSKTNLRRSVFIPQKAVINKKFTFYHMLHSGDSSNFSFWPFKCSLKIFERPFLLFMFCSYLIWNFFIFTFKRFAQILTLQFYFSYDTIKLHHFKKTTNLIIH